jgi:hypothetical protein
MKILERAFKMKYFIELYDEIIYKIRTFAAKK